MKPLGLIPAYDAAGTVGGVVEGALRQLDDVLVVDDGSTDGTAQAARNAGASVICHGRNLGKGEALKTGFKYALERGYDAVVTLDADGQHDPADIPRLVNAAWGGAGIVIGARLWDKGKIPRARYYTNLVGVKCISWRAKSPLDDSQSGFRLYTADVLKSVGCGGTGFEAETELLIRAGRSGFKIASVPVRVVYNEDVLRSSHFRTVSDTYRICMVFLKSFMWPIKRL